MALKMRNDLTAEYLRSILNYDSEKGSFTWKEREISDHRIKTWNKRYAGKIAGFIHCSGYIAILINYKTYLAHRLAWLYMTGSWPAEQIDHKDLNRKNFIWKNLREATQSENMHNCSKQINNTSGFKNVFFIKKRKNRKWMSRVIKNRKLIYLRHFTTPKEAAYWYEYAAKYYHKEFARIA